MSNTQSMSLFGDSSLPASKVSNYKIMRNNGSLLGFITVGAEIVGAEFELPVWEEGLPLQELLAGTVNLEADKIVGKTTILTPDIKDIISSLFGGTVDIANTSKEVKVALTPSLDMLSVLASLVLNSGETLNDTRDLEELPSAEFEEFKHHPQFDLLKQRLRDDYARKVRAGEIIQ